MNLLHKERVRIRGGCILRGLSSIKSFHYYVDYVVALGLDASEEGGALREMGKEVLFICPLLYAVINFFL